MYSLLYVSRVKQQRLTMITHSSKTLLCCPKFSRARETIPLKIVNLVTQSQKGSPTLSCDNNYRPITEESGINARNEPIHNIWGYHDSEFLDYGLLGCDALWEDSNVSNEFPFSVLRAEDYQTTRCHISSEFLKEHFFSTGLATGCEMSSVSTTGNVGMLK